MNQIIKQYDSPDGIQFPATTINGVDFRPIQRHEDSRGGLFELFRMDELPEELHPTMAYISSTLPGVIRGPHEHREQTDLFAFVGPGDFLVRLWDARPKSPTFEATVSCVVGESDPRLVIIPPGVVHGYRNLSTYPGWVFNAPNRLYRGEGKRSPVDEIRHEVNPNSPYQF